jgi:hypothetical protein
MSLSLIICFLCPDADPIRIRPYFKNEPNPLIKINSMTGNLLVILGYIKIVFPVAVYILIFKKSTTIKNT